MNYRKLLPGALLGAVVFFLLGWLIYGVLMADYFYKYSGKAGHIINRAETEYNFLFMACGNLLMGLLLAYALLRMRAAGFLNGMITGALLCALMVASLDCTVYATTWVLSKHAILGDVLAYAVMGGAAGGVIGLLNRDAES